MGGRMNKKAGWIVIILFLAFLTSCKGATAWKGSIETVDGVQIVRNPKAPMYPEGALSLQEDLTIGTAEGAEEYMFIRLRWLFVDESGSIYTLDQRKPRIDVFDGDGRHGAGGGNGPGKVRGKMGQALPAYLRLMEDELGRDRDLLQVSAGNEVARLHDESHREPEPADQEDCEKQGDLPQRTGPRQAGLSRHRGRVEEMDLPPQGVGCDIFPTDDLFWGTLRRARLNARKGFTQNI
jgi:hypothetical protein